MSDIAFIGDHDTVMGFKGLGISVYYTEHWETQEESVIKIKLNEVIRSGFKVILLTEDVFIKYKALLIELLEGKSLPVILPIPNNTGSKGVGIERIRSLAEKAIGTDIFTKDMV